MTFKLYGCKPLGQNEKLKRGKGLRLYKSTAYVKSWNQVKAIMLSQSVGITLDDKSRFSVHVLVPRKWNEDIDAFQKESLDTLQGFVYKNDSQVDEVGSKWHDENYMQIEVNRI